MVKFRQVIFLVNFARTRITYNGGQKCICIYIFIKKKHSCCLNETMMLLETVSRRYEKNVNYKNVSFLPKEKKNARNGAILLTLDG